MFNPFAPVSTLPAPLPASRAVARRAHESEQTTFLAPSRGSRITAGELLKEVDEYFSLGATVRPGDTVIDVGANVGAFALRAADRCNGNLSLYCFEPSPPTFAALDETFRRNPVLRQTRHKIRRSGLTSHEQTDRACRFYHFRRFPTNSTLDLASKRREFEIFFEHHGARARRWLGPGIGAVAGAFIAWLPRGPVGRWLSDRAMGLEVLDVELETLDDVVSRESLASVDLLKIDVEGHELDVLRGLGPGSWPRIKQIVLETSDRDGQQTAILALLARHGMTRIQVVPQRANDNGLDSQLVLACRPA